MLGLIGVDLLPWAGLTLLALIIRLLPAPVQALVQKFRTQQLDQLLERDLGFAAAQFRDRINGEEMTVDVHNQLVAVASHYAIDHGAKAVLDYAGNQPALQQKLSARVLTSPAVQAAQGLLSPRSPRRSRSDQGPHHRLADQPGARLADSLAGPEPANGEGPEGEKPAPILKPKARRKYDGHPWVRPRQRNVEVNR